MGIAEVDLDVDSDAKSLMVSEFLAAIPRHRLVEFLRYLTGVFDKGSDARLGTLTEQFHQHYGAVLTL